jgi:hypothetical protein
MKVRFENYGDLLIVRNRAIRLDIPARAVGDKAVVAALPDTEAAQRMILNLTRRHRTLHVCFVDEQGGKSAPLPESPEQEGQDVDGQESKVVTEETSSELPEAICPELSVEDFKSMVKSVAKGSAGWWTVEIEGQDPMKMRGATSEEDAIERAYEEYLEGIE